MATENRRALAASLLAGDVPPKPPADEMSPPVAWLLGPEVIGGLKSFLLYASYKGELDTHDWMQAAPVVVDAPEGASELWFDYVSDIGDGQLAMYTTALVMQDDLLVEGGLDEIVRARAAAAALPLQGPRPGWSTLPRGRLLVTGGDTAYPLADITNLQSHVRHPFTWAYRDLVAAGRILDAEGRPPPPCDLFGVPGNHDYYDELTGFNRMFRAPAGDEVVPGRPRLDLLGTRRLQTASYFALRLPWGWRFWGVDPGGDGLDDRQELFFRAEGPPDKLIVAYPSPPIAYGRVILDRALLEDVVRLGLPLPYLDATTPLLDGKPPGVELPRPLAPGQCRLDLSGDAHHYERYRGDGECYAAVVSGAGGAFHHPSFPDFGEVPRRAVYPAPERSRRAVADALFNPRTIFNGGIVSVAAFALALVVTAGSMRRDTRVVTDVVLGWLGVHMERALGSDAAAARGHALGWNALAGAAWFSAAIVTGLALVFAAFAYARWVTRTLRRPRREWPRLLRAMRAFPLGRVLEDRGYLPSWILVIAAVALPALTGQMVALPSAAALLFQLTFVWLVVGLAAALVVFGGRSGGMLARPGGRLGFYAFGAMHALIQLTLPFVVVRLGLGDTAALFLALAVGGAAALLGRWLLCRGARWALLALWLAHWAAIVAILAVGAGGVAAVPGSTLGWAEFLVVAGLFGAVLGCLEYGWYLAVAVAHDGHENETGAAARIERFRQFIRFRLEPQRLTGFVIAVDEPTDDPAAVRPRVVDVFTIAPR